MQDLRMYLNDNNVLASILTIYISPDFIDITRFQKNSPSEISRSVTYNEVHKLYRGP